MRSPAGRGLVVLIAALCCGLAFAPAHAADGSLVVAALHVLDQNYVEPVDDVGLLNAAIGALRTAAALGAEGLPDIPAGAVAASASRMFLDDFDRAAQSATGSATDLAYAATNAMLASLHDSHVNFYRPAEFTEFQRSLAGQASYAGIGVFVKSIEAADGTNVAFVSAAFPGGPAARAGLQRFDRILRVDGKDVSGMKAGDLVPLLRGSAHSTVVLAVKRRERTFNVSIVREAIQIPPVEARFIRPGVAYVRLFGFSRGAGRQTRAALGSLASRGSVSSVILDLRSNGGGLIEEGSEVAGAFLPPATLLGHTLERARPPAVLRSTGTPVASARTRLIVLIDDGTASTAELVTAGLHDAHRATLIGEKTAGALGVALRYPLPEGGIEVTVSKVTGPLYEQIEGVGITPDVRVDLSVDEVTRGEDVQLEAALRNLGLGGLVRLVWAA
ncbi:MAG TPA: S41 family peptidase [bacterium]|nr:S41 family peptidase [bacterium]